MAFEKEGKRLFPNLRLRMMQERQQLLAGDLARSGLAGEGEAVTPRRRQLVEELGKALASAQILAPHDLLDLFGQGVGGMRAQLAQIMGEIGEARVGEELFHLRGGQLRDCQLEKKSLLAGGGEGFAHLRQQGLVRFHRAIGGKEELGIGVRPQPP